MPRMYVKLRGLVKSKKSKNSDWIRFNLTKTLISYIMHITLLQITFSNLISKGKYFAITSPDVAATLQRWGRVLRIYLSILEMYFFRLLNLVLNI